MKTPDNVGTSLFGLIQKTCDRTDCKIQPGSFILSNSAGSTEVWSCRTCGRKWSVHTAERQHETTYDRRGQLLP